MLRKSLIIGGIAVITSCSTGVLAQDNASTSVPYCESPLGCFLTGVHLPSDAYAVGRKSDLDAAPAQRQDSAAPIAATAEPANGSSVSHPSLSIAGGAQTRGRIQRLTSIMKNDVRLKSAASSTTADLTVTEGTSNEAKGVRLFSEQMHVVASLGVRSMADLKGKRVSFGPPNSDNQEAARQAFKVLQVAVDETPLDFDNALDAMSTGDIDAVVFFGPEPIKQLERLNAPGLHLVAWPDGVSAPPGETTAKIDTAQYPGLGDAKSTIVAVAIEAKLQTRHAEKPEVKRFLASLSQHTRELSKAGFDLVGSSRGVVARDDR